MTVVIPANSSSIFWDRASQGIYAFTHKQPAYPTFCGGEIPQIHRGSPQQGAVYILKRTTG